MKVFTFLFIFCSSLITQASQLRLGLGFGYASQSKINFSDVSDSDSARSYTTELKFNDQISLELDIRDLPAHSWGYIAGLSYGFERQVQSAEITDNNITQTVIVKDSARFQSTVLSANAAYMWEQIYVPFGLNYHFVQVKPRSGFNGTMSANGGLGVQFGAGLMIEQNFSAEFMVRSVEMSLKQTEPSVTTDYGKGFIVDPSLNIKYIF